MKRSKLLAAALAATMFATAACGLVACDKDAGSLPTGTTDNNNPPAGKTYTVTFDANGGTLSGSKTLKTNTAGIVQGTVPTASKADSTFKGWSLEKGATTTITFSSQKFTNDKTVYAVYTAGGGDVGTEYTITLEYGEGSGSPASMQTSGGKLTTLPNPTAPSGKKFDGWFTAATGGTKVTTSTPFTANGSIYAQYSVQQQQGGGESALEGAVTIDTTADDIGYMVDVNAPDKGVEMEFNAGEYGDEYVLKNYHLDKDVVIKFQNGTGDMERTTFEDDCPAAEYFTAAAGGLKVVKGGTYTFYVKKDTDQIWVELVAPDFEDVEGDVITITVTCADGTITFKVEKVDGRGTYLHGWQKGSGTGLFTESWPGKAVSDGDTVDLSGYNMTDIGLIINRGDDNGKTKDIFFTTGGNKTVTVSKDGGSKVE